MCGVVGIWMKDELNLEFIKNIILESKIRGLHATGISWIENNQITTVKSPIPADKFLETFDLSQCVYNNELRMVAHVRYNTCNSPDDQPIADINCSIVHNGVIDQSNPQVWQEKYKNVGPFETGNDSEIIKKYIEFGKNPLVELRSGSIAVCELHSVGSLRVYRNQYRPLYYAKMENGYAFASTFDILKRTGEKTNTDLDIKLTTPYYIYLLDSRYKMKEIPIKFDAPDLQLGHVDFIKELKL